MPPEHRPLVELEDAAWTRQQDIIRSFREAWLRGERRAIEEYAPKGDSERTELLLELVHEEIELKIRAGEPAEPAAYLERFPELAGALSMADARAQGGGALACSAKLPSSSRPGGRVGRYELGEVIGRGAFGVVYRGWDTALNRAVAVKRPHPGVVETAETVERFLREARNAARLRHPHIVPVHDAGQADGELYLVATLVEGRNLAEELAAGRPGFRRSAEWVAALAEALEHAHGLGVVHRDVKPSNVLIDRDDCVYLTDFGLAKSEGGETTLTRDGQMLGTPAYMAPEQAGNEKATVDARTDVYSLGVILYELLTGSRPFAGVGPILLARIREEDPRPPRRLDDKISRDLETICLRAMSKEPAHRYQSAAAFAADLHRFLRGEPVKARPAGPLGTLWRKCRRKPVLAGLAASLVLAVALGFIGVTWQWRRAERARARAVEALDQIKRIMSTYNDTNEIWVWSALDPSASRERLRTAILVHYRAALPRWRNDPALLPEIAQESRQVAQLLEETRPTAEAISAWQEAQDLIEGVLRSDPGNLHCRVWLASCMMRRSRLLRGAGRSREGQAAMVLAEERWREAFALVRQRLDAAPRDLILRLILADCELHFGACELDLGRRVEARAAFQRLCEISERLIRDEPEVHEAWRFHVHALVALADSDGDDISDEAVALRRQVIDRYGEFFRTNPDPSAQSLRLTIADCAYNLATKEDHRGRSNEALRYFQRAVELFESFEQSGGLLVDQRGALAASLHVIGRLRAEHGRPDEAIEPYQKAIAIREALCRAEPGNLRHPNDAAGSWHRLGAALEKLGRYEQARSAYQKACEMRRALVARAPAEIEYRKGLDAVLRELARCLARMGQPAEMTAVVQERVSLWSNDRERALGVAGKRTVAPVSALPGEPASDKAPASRRGSEIVGVLTAWGDAARHALTKSAAMPGRTSGRPPAAGR